MGKQPTKKAAEATFRFNKLIVLTNTINIVIILFK